MNESRMKNPKTAERYACILCHKALTTSVGTTPYDNLDGVNDGTVWSHKGSYGSSLMDGVPFSYGYDELITFICDDCLKTNVQFIYARKSEVVKKNEIAVPFKKVFKSK